MVDTQEQPLHGYKILITRATDQAGDIVNYIYKLGGTAVCIPMIEIGEPESWDACDKAIIHSKKYDGVIFTSANAVRGFVSRLEEKFPHAKLLIQKRTIYAVGKKTKESLTEFGILTHAVPEEYTADAVVEMIKKTGVAGKTFLFPVGNLTRDIIDTGLTEAGAVVDRIPVYTTSKPADVDREQLNKLLEDKALDFITFFSPSGVQHFFEMVDTQDIENIPIAVIGQTTYDAVAGYGIQPQIKPGEATAEDLINTIAEYIYSIK